MSRPDPLSPVAPASPGAAWRLDPALLAQAIEVRRHLHRHPELSNQEERTQSYLRHCLLEAGLTEIRDVAGYGLAVDIAGTAGPSNRKVAVRADIDALPIMEESGVEFSSETPGVMHACGHDAHAAMGFAAAALLNERRDSFRGTVRIIFQPAEEAEPLGGRRVVEEGLLDDVDAAIGIHVDPYTPTGKIALGAGPYTLACDTFDIVVAGVAAHAAKPAEGVDALAAACSLVLELQKIVAREIDAFDPLVISVTAIEGGSAYNVLADRVSLKGTVRYGNEPTRDHAWNRIREIAYAVSRAHRAQAQVHFTAGEPAVVNDREMVQLVEASVRQLFGPEAVLSAPGWAVADDFAFYSQKCPSEYNRLGRRKTRSARSTRCIIRGSGSTRRPWRSASPRSPPPPRDSLRHPTEPGPDADPQAHRAPPLLICSRTNTHRGSMLACRADRPLPTGPSGDVMDFPELFSLAAAAPVRGGSLPMIHEPGMAGTKG